MQQLIKKIESEYMKEDAPDVKVGSTVEVGVKIIEGNKERVQPYKGLVISNEGKGISKSIVVRKISFGIGVERKFLLNSPKIAHVKLIKYSKPRRAKLYYLRTKVGKKASMV